MRDEFEQLPRRGVQMCVVLVGPHLLGLFQLYSLSFKLNSTSSHPSGLVDQVLTSTLSTLRVLLTVMERVDAPFCEHVLKIFSRFLSERQTQPTPGSLSSSDALYNTLLFHILTDEMRSELCLILTLLFSKLSPVALASVLLPAHLSPLFFIVYQILDIAVHDKNRVNQRQALKSIKHIILALSPSPIPSLLQETKASFTGNPLNPTTPTHTSTEGQKRDSNSPSLSPSDSAVPHNAIASIVPGILSSCTRILMGDFKQGDGVFCASLELLSTSIVSTMADCHNAHLVDDNASLTSDGALSKLKAMMMKGGKEETKSPSSKSSSLPSTTSSTATPSPKASNTPSSAQEAPGKIERTADWFKKASYHISLVLERIFSMSRIMAEDVNSAKSISAIVIRSGRVRLKMAKCAGLILSLCRRSLSPSFAVLFELLVLFAFDEFDDVSSLASQRLQSLETDNLHLLLSSYTSHVSQLIQSIPRIMRGSDEHKKLLLLRLVTGWTRISTSISSAVLPALAEALTGFAHLLPVAPSLIFLNPQVSLLTGSDTGPDSNQSIDFASLALLHLRQTYQSQFAYFKDKRIYESLASLIRHLGAQGNVETYFDLFFSLQSTEPQGNYSDDSESSAHSSWISDRAAHIFVLNEVMMGASGFLDSSSDRRTKLSREARAKLKDQWEHYLSYLLGDHVWIQGRSEENAVFRHRLILAMEGLGNMSLVFGKQFEKYFVQTLYRLLAMAGSEVELLNRVGKMTLVRFAHHTGYATVVKMVENNLDYVVEEMTRELRYGEDVKTALKVFSGLLALRSALIVPLLHDIIEDIFKRLDFAQEGHSAQLIGVLALVIRVVSSHVPHSQNSRMAIKALNRRVSEMMMASQAAEEEPSMNSRSTASSAAPTPSTSLDAKEDLLEDFTMHSWIQRCELEYMGRKDLQRPSTPSDQPNTVRITVADDHQSAEYDARGESRMARGQDAESEDDAFVRSRAARTLQFQNDLSSSYIQEDESALKQKGGFGLAKWLRTRVSRRKTEASALDAMRNPGASSFSDQSSKSAESFFRDHHQEKQEKADRGDDLHEGADEASRAAIEDEEIDSDEEYKYPESYVSQLVGGDENSSENSSKLGDAGVPKRKLSGKFVKLPHRPGYDVVHSIVQRLVNWMSVPDVEVKCAVLRALSGGLSVLAEHRKIMLPTLHTVWLALQWRFLDKDERVVQAAWQLVREVGMYARNFLAQKFCDLWPLLRDLVRAHNPFLTEGMRYIAKANVVTQYSAVGAGNSTNFDAFNSSASYKVQAALLSTITFATQHLSLPAHTVLEMAREVWFYLSDSQPLRLQQHALSFYKAIMGWTGEGEERGEESRSGTGKSEEANDFKAKEKKEKNPIINNDPNENPFTNALKGSDANGLFLLLSLLLSQPLVPPTSSIDFLQGLSQHSTTTSPSDSPPSLPSLAPSKHGILPSKFSSHPDTFFTLFRKNASVLLQQARLPSEA